MLGLFYIFEFPENVHVQHETAANMKTPDVACLEFRHIVNKNTCIKYLCDWNGNFWLRKMFRFCIIALQLQFFQYTVHSLPFGDRLNLYINVNYEEHLTGGKM